MKHLSNRSQGNYLFFNEIEEVPGWDIAARRIVDTERIAMCRARWLLPQAIA